MNTKSNVQILDTCKRFGRCLVRLFQWDYLMRFCWSYSLLILFWIGLTPVAQSHAATDKDLKQITHDISLIRDSQVELRRDQLNYKIEKDLLKESYASSLQTVNMAVTFILGLLTVLGYLGIRDIGSLKKEYSEELEKLGVLRKQLEEQLNKVTIEQKSVRAELTNILTANRDQDARIKLLELQEKAGALMAQNNYVRALDYIDAGLEIAKDDWILLNQKASCLYKTNNVDDAIKIYETLLNSNPDHLHLPGLLGNLAEGFLLLKQFDKYEALKKSHVNVLNSVSDGALAVFLESLKAAMQGDSEAIKTALIAFAKQQSFPQQKPWMPGWDYSDSNRFVTLSSDEIAKSAFAIGISFFSGAINSQQLLDNLGSLTVVASPN